MGDTYSIVLTYDTESNSETGSSSSRGGYAYVERVVETGPEGIVKELDIAEPREERVLIEWQFPVIYREDAQGELHLVNREEMEARRDAFLMEAEIDPEACGSWFFTWNAFQIECDPEDVLELISWLDLQSGVTDSSYLHPNALEGGDLVATDHGAYLATMPLDPDTAKRQLAQSDVVVSELMGEPVTLQEATAKRAQEDISGTIEVTLELDEQDRFWRRSILTDYVRTDAMGVTETTSRTEVTERELIATSAGSS